jgi:cell division protease FtsH
MMGGRAAEELFFGEITTGAQNDIAQANALARRMVTEFGMSSLGHISVGEGDMIGVKRSAQIDDVTHRLVEDAYARARDIVTERRVALAAIAEHLCEVETMDGHELDRWLESYPPSPGDDVQPRAAGSDSSLQALSRSPIPYVRAGYLSQPRRPRRPVPRRW